jgi:fatty acid desaturase
MSSESAPTSKSRTTGLGTAVPKDTGAMKRIAIVSFILFLSSGCVVIGGHSSGRGWFFWPGPLVILLGVALLLMFRRRGR